MGNVVYLEARKKQDLSEREEARRRAQERLSAAFAELQRALAEALAEQREACQSFKDEVKRLDTAIGRLSDNLTNYRSSLSKINTQPLRAKSLRLARLADRLGEQAEDLSDLTRPQSV